MLVEVRTELARELQNALDGVAQAATEHGIGVITFDAGEDIVTWDEVIAQRCDAPPEALNDFIETQISPAGQRAIETAVAHSRVL